MPPTAGSAAAARRRIALVLLQIGGLAAQVRRVLATDPLREAA